MVGGKVHETIVLEDRVWIRAVDGRSTCAIYVERTAQARCVSEGDGIWWQGEFAMWTPKKANRLGKTGVDYDIFLRRVGTSGIKRPTTV